MVFQIDRWCFASILLTILLLIQSARANSSSERLAPVASGADASVVSGLTSSKTDDVNGFATPGNLDLNDTRKADERKANEQTSEQSVQLKLSDLQNMVIEYLDENLPPLDKNDTQAERDGSDEEGTQRSFGKSQLLSRLTKFADRYIHPDFSSAVTATGRVFLLKGKINYSTWIR